MTTEGIKCYVVMMYSRTSFKEFPLASEVIPVGVFFCYDEAVKFKLTEEDRAQEDFSEEFPDWNREMDFSYWIKETRIQGTAGDHNRHKRRPKPMSHRDIMINDYNCGPAFGDEWAAWGRGEG